MSKTALAVTLFGYCILAYLLLQVPFHLYTPARDFDLPGLLWLTHLILLYIHEAGHFLFSLFGRTMMILGGSLSQVLAPVLWYVTAKREGSQLSNAALIFTGISLADVSIYVKDAGMLVLPLIGGLSRTHHDWANLLNDWGMIEYGAVLGEVLFWIGFIMSLYGLIAGIRFAIQSYLKGTGTTGAFTSE